nr:L-lactate dehydrogenase B-like [Tanacetum cinerariifolium]
KSASSLALGPGGLDIAQSFFKPIHGASQPSTTSRNTKISVIGVGNVGMAIAQTILTQDLADEIALMDVNADKLPGEMLDLQHAAAFLPRTTISASVDYSSTVGSDLVIVIPPLPAASPEAILLIVSNPVDVLTYVAWKLSGLPANRVIGSSTNLDSSRFRFLIADHLDVNAQDVHRQQIAYEKKTLENIHKEVVQGAHKVIGFKGYTSWAIGYSVANLARTILRDQHKGESRALGVTNLHLSEEESQQLQKSAKTILEDLWKLCQSYGTVVDVYILNRRSKAGKRFAFVWFIKVDNVDRLVGNLCMLWIGHMHLHANVVRFERTPSQVPRPSQPVRKATHTGNAFASVVKGNLVSPMSSSPALVLDDTCLKDRDYENCVMGEILQFSSISDLRILLFHEGFLSVRTVYLGGLWVMLELNSPETKNKLMNHVGVPLHAWSRATFAKIGSKWVEMMDLEDGSDDLFERKRICINTNRASNILETFKIIVKRKVFWVRAKELFVWSLMFKETPEVEHSSDDVSTKGEADNVVEGSGLHNDDEESNTEAVFDTYFGDNVVNVDNAEAQGQEKDFGNPTVNVEVSSDHFNIYGLLNNRKKDNGTAGSNTTPPFPPGSNTRIAKEAGNVDGNLYTDNRSCGFKLKEGGSILDILDEMIKVGQTMGFSMVGCTKDMEGISGAQGENVVFDELSFLKCARPRIQG